MDVEAQPVDEVPTTLNAETQSSPDLLMLTAYGPTDATLHIWWHETPRFSLADYLPATSVFHSGMELLRRRPEFSGQNAAQAIKAWFWKNFQQQPVTENCDEEMKDWVLHFQCEAELHNCHHTIQRWPMAAAIRGKLRIEISMDSSETEMDLTFVSDGLSTRLPWSGECETHYGSLPFVQGLKPATTDRSIEDFQGVILKLLSAERTEKLCVVM